MEQIQLFKTSEGWMSRSDDPLVVEVFGTDTLPTAFTAEAPAAVVLAEIQKLNPQAQVSIE